MTASDVLTDLAARLSDLTLIDERRLRRRLRNVRGTNDAARRERALDDLERQVSAAEKRISRRLASVPAVTFPPDLPVSRRVEELEAAIAANQVVIVAGETGSGKSTQLPKVCLRMGRGVRGLIGHTQPRRIAARALAERIAEETGTRLGDAIGYTIRFGDYTGQNTLVKLMTDGILLAEITRDRMLSAYDTIIIDEAHERSLNIDFLLGYLVELLPRRPDLKLIVTSATIDPERFARHFGGAPVVEVSGRMYPVEIRYRPYGIVDRPTDDDADDPEGTEPADPTPRSRATEDTRDQAQAITDAVDELIAAGPGDILVFLSGEREITDTAEVLRGYLAGRPGLTEVLPLYGRLSAADQHRVFEKHTGRRIVLATNVAETSLTVPGIRYVIDPGTARISRYSPRSKVQRLPIEEISQASASQRAGRCGRLEDGICIRLYSADDFAQRPEFTDPEIVRTALASVILQMAALNLGDIATFPFIDPPDRRQVTDGITVLNELGALEKSAGDGRLTSPGLTQVGRSMAALPVDPRLARMIVEGHARNCLREVLVIVSALAIVDVREYPLDDRDRATAAHARFVDPRSDFNAVLNLWRYLRDQAGKLSGNKFRRLCRSEYLHYLRIREWQDLHAQLLQVTGSLGIVPAAEPAPADPEDERRQPPAAGGETGPAEPPNPKDRPSATQAGRGALATEIDTERVHAALLAGLLSHIGRKAEPDRKAAGRTSRTGRRPESSRDYQGARGTTFMIWPGSALAKSGARLVVAAELVETSRLWGRLCAAIEPEWVETVGGDLLRRSHSEPRWDARRASVVATEKLTLLGVTLVDARTVQFDRIDAELSRELFIRHALVERDWQTRHTFFAANQAAIDEVAEWEERTRRRDIVVDDETLFALYDARIPADVTSGRRFDAWWKKEARRHPELLTFTPDMLIAAGSERFDRAAYPDTFGSAGVELPLDYVFDPSRTDDGVTVTIPLAVLARVDPTAFGSQIPGLRRDLVIALIRSLPKTLRRQFVPVPDFATAALERMSGQSDDADFAGNLARVLTSLGGTVIGADDFDVSKVPDHLRMNFAVVDQQGQTVARGRDLSALQDELRSDARRELSRAAGDSIERSGLTTFPETGIPRSVESEVRGHRVTGFPALVDEGPTLGVRVFATEAEQAAAMRAGTRRLLTLGAGVPLNRLRNGLSREQKLTLSASRYGSARDLVADATEAAVDALLDWASGPVWTAAEFAALASRIAPHLHRATFDVVVAAEAVLRAARDAERAIDGLATGPAAAAVPDIVIDLRSRLEAAIAPGFITRAGAARLPDVGRYLQALAVRAGRVRDNPERDRQRMREIGELEALVDQAVAELPEERRDSAEVRELRRLLEEQRVTLFAQPMKAAVPVSAKRIGAAAAALRRVPR